MARSTSKTSRRARGKEGGLTVRRHGSPRERYDSVEAGSTFVKTICRRQTFEVRAKRQQREEAMETTRYPSRIDSRFTIACAVAGLVALLAAPALAQTPAGIPGVVAPGLMSELVQEGFTFTEG